MATPVRANPGHHRVEGFHEGYLRKVSPIEVAGSDALTLDMSPEKIPEQPALAPGPAVAPPPVLTTPEPPAPAESTHPARTRAYVSWGNGRAHPRRRGDRRSGARGGEQPEEREGGTGLGELGARLRSEQHEDPRPRHRHPHRCGGGGGGLSIYFTVDASRAASSEPKHAACAPAIRATIAPTGASFAVRF